MNSSALAARFVSGPHIADSSTAEQRLADWLAELEPAQAADIRAWLGRPAARAILLGIAEFSPYLFDLVRADAARLIRLLACDPEAHLAALIENTSRDVLAAASEADVMHLLRRMKSEAALMIAVCDIGGVWPVMRVTAALTDLAVNSVQAGLRFLLRQEVARGRMTAAEPDRPEEGCGLIVLAMGKMGAGELNYSSDIDLIVFFDPAATSLVADIEPAPFFVRVTQALARLLQQRSGEGYVFRVDLRLRPDPASTQVAISTDAALYYYEREGRTWERAAMIKARACAGDAKAGAALVAELSPFVWRKHLDFAALADVHDMKRQMQTYRGQSEIAVEGHNVKVGRGGIREIEFFAQTQQLIAGGRHPELRVRPTLQALQVLATSNWITLQACEELTAAYEFLRRVEHRLQMIADEQTHSLPDDAEAVERFANFFGYESREAFAKDLLGHLNIVQGHYGKLFEGDPTGTVQLPQVDYAAGPEDARLLDHLANLGFKKPVAVAGTVQLWMQGNYRALRNEATKAAFIEFVPGLIDGLAHAEDPDDAVIAFDRFLIAAGEPRPGRAGGADPRGRAAARRHAGAPAADHGRPDRSALLRRDAGPEGTVGAAGDDAEARRLLRGFSRSPAPVRPGEPVPDRHAHPLRHGVRAAGERRLCRRRGGHRAHRAWVGDGSVRHSIWPHPGAGDRDPRNGPARQPRDDGVFRSRPDPAV
jgi:glutamate-ammonia-ligase adenylyltransferase